jgi:hypothetical protein
MKVQRYCDIAFGSLKDVILRNRNLLEAIAAFELDDGRRRKRASKEFWRRQCPRDAIDRATTLPPDDKAVELSCLRLPMARAIIATVISACRLKAALASKSKSTMAMPVSLLCSFGTGCLKNSAKNLRIGVLLHKPSPCPHRLPISKDIPFRSQRICRACQPDIADKV